MLIIKSCKLPCLLLLGSPTASSYIPPCYLSAVCVDRMRRRAEGLARNENRWENKAGGGRSRRRGGADGTERGNIVLVAPVSCTV